MSTRAFVCVLAGVLAAACSGQSPITPTSTVALEPSAFPLSGVVRESLPAGTAGDPLAGARVEVVGKPGVLAAALTDASGGYRFDSVAGTFQLHIVKAGYEARTVTVSHVTAPRVENVQLTPQPRTLSGAVFEAPPTQTTPVATARVTIISGANAGRTATTDARGAYILPGVWGEFDVRVERDGYVAAVAHAALAGEDTSLDVRLSPTPRTITQTLVPPSFGGFAVSVAVHNDGEIAVTDWAAYGFEEGDTSTLQIREDGRLIAQTAVERSFPRHTIVLRAAAHAGHTYEIRAIVQFFWYTATISYPS